MVAPVQGMRQKRCRLASRCHEQDFLHLASPGIKPRCKLCANHRDVRVAELRGKEAEFPPGKAEKPPTLCTPGMPWLMLATPPAKKSRAQGTAAACDRISLQWDANHLHRCWGKSAFGILCQGSSPPRLPL